MGLVHFQTPMPIEKTAHSFDWSYTALGVLSFSTCRTVPAGDVSAYTLSIHFNLLKPVVRAEESLKVSPYGVRTMHLSSTSHLRLQLKAIQVLRRAGVADVTGIVSCSPLADTVSLQLVLYLF